MLVSHAPQCCLTVVPQQSNHHNGLHGNTSTKNYTCGTGCIRDNSVCLNISCPAPYGASAQVINANFAPITQHHMLESHCQPHSSIVTVICMNRAHPSCFAYKHHSSHLHSYLIRINFHLYQIGSMFHTICKCFPFYLWAASLTILSHFTVAAIHWTKGKLIHLPHREAMMWKVLPWCFSTSLYDIVDDLKKASVLLTINCNMCEQYWPNRDPSLYVPSQWETT